MRRLDACGKFVSAGVAALAAVASRGTARAGITVLYAFRDGTDGSDPQAGVTQDVAGNLYGTTLWGGDPKCYSGGCGTVFKLAPDGTETVLYVFGKHRRDGKEPFAGLMEGATGRLFGTASGGGRHGYGTVFSLKK